MIRGSFGRSRRCFARYAVVESLSVGEILSDFEKINTIDLWIIRVYLFINLSPGMGSTINSPHPRHIQHTHDSGAGFLRVRQAVQLGCPTRVWGIWESLTTKQSDSFCSFVLSIQRYKLVFVSARLDLPFMFYASFRSFQYAVSGYDLCNCF